MNTPAAVPTVRIRATHPASQGEFVEINQADFDPAVHELYEPAPPVAQSRKPQKPKE